MNTGPSRTANIDIALTCVVWGVVSLVAGCGEPPQVTIETREHKDRTLVAYIPRDSEAWFVKLSGPTAFVDPLESTYQTFLDGMTFQDDGRPTFELVDGFAKQPSDGPGQRFRFATYGDGGPVEIAVTRLPATDPLADDYIQINVDRWLRELNLPPRKRSWREAAEERDELTVRDIAGAEAFVFDFHGSIIPARTARIIQAEQVPETLNYDVPEDWTEQAGDAFRLAIFDVPGDVEATVSSAMGSLRANINRWEGQVGLTPRTDQEILEDLEQLTVDGHGAGLIKLVGVRDDQPTTIIGVVIVTEQKQYFVKMTGPSDAVDEAEAAFRQFLTTIRFG